VTSTCSCCYARVHHAARVLISKSSCDFPYLRTMQYSHSLHESQNIFVTISVLSIVNSLLLYRQWWIEFFYQHCFTYFHLFSLNFFKTFIFIFITYLCLPQKCKSPFRRLNLNCKNNTLWSRWHKLCVDKTHCWGKMRKRDEIDKTSPIITRECCSSSLSRNSHPKVRIIFEKKKPCDTWFFSYGITVWWPVS